MKIKSFAALLLAAIISVNSPAYATGKASPSPSPTASASPATDKAKYDEKQNDKKQSDEKQDSKSQSDEKQSDENKNDKSGTSDNTQKAESEKNTDENKKKGDFPVPNADAAYVMDSRSGDVIYTLNPDKRVYQAGLTNLMTAIIALESKNLADTCTVTAEALDGITYDQPQFGMKEGEVFTVEQLLHAIILNSNNDASNTLAIGVAGSVSAFVDLMNQKAAELGLSGTHFANPSGYQNENHYTTAADMAVLSQYVMKNQTFMQIAATQKYTFPASNVRSSEKTILSTNHLVSRYKYPYHYYANATGLKSGNSTDAGYCLAASAVKGNLSIISVVMGAPNADAKDKAYSFTDTKAIFDYVFENYQAVLLAKKGDVIHDTKVSEAKNSTRLALTVEEDIYATMKNTADPEMIKNEVTLTEEAKAPIEQGSLFGTVTYTYNERELRTVNLVAANEVKRDFILHIINSILGFIFNPIVLLIIIAVLVIWARLRIVRNRKRRIRRSRMVSQSGKVQGSSRNTQSRSRTNDPYRRRR